MNQHGTVSAHDRLLESGKSLFASRGFSNTSTIMIARAAGTSESQLVKHFGSKDGLLEAIFDRCWKTLMPFPEAAGCASPSEYLRQLIEQAIAGMEGDPALRELFLLESRRIRREDNIVMVSSSYAAFVHQVDEALTGLRDHGQLNSEAPVPAVRAAILGMCEGLLRDQLLAQRQGGDPGYTPADVRRVIDTILSSFIIKTPR